MCYDLIQLKEKKKSQMNINIYFTLAYHELEIIKILIFLIAKNWRLRLLIIIN